MAKKPKKPWQVKARAKIDEMGIGYAELAERIGTTYNNVNQAMCKDNMPGIKEKICKYLDVEE